MKNQRGNVLVMVVILLAVLLVLVPGLIQFVTTDSRMSVKAGGNTRAFQMAETALERGFQSLIQSTTTLALVSSGTLVAGYHFDVTYSEPGMGDYQIGFASQTATTILVTGVGRPTAGSEVRGVRAEFARVGDISNAITAEGVVGMGGSTEVEWASVLSRTSINTAGRDHPRFYSVGNISPQDANGVTPPNSDNVQWWSYKTDLPPNPTLDMAYYQAQAQAGGPLPPLAEALSIRWATSRLKDATAGLRPPSVPGSSQGTRPFRPVRVEI